MLLFRILIPILLLFYNCSTDIDVQTTGISPPLTDVLTLELSFGDEKTIVKDEFLLAQPVYITVNDEGDIFVVDENSVKVFNKNGKEKRILGRTGQGPGEFENAYYATIGPAGYLTVDAGILSGYYNFYSPDYVFKEKIRLRSMQKYKNLKNEKKFSSFECRKVISLSEKQRIVICDGSEEYSDNPYRRIELLIYENGEDLIELAQYRDISIYSYPGEFYPRVSFQGDFYWDIISDNRIIFTHTYYDKSVDSKSPAYVFHIISLENFKKSQLSHPYTPVEIPLKIKKMRYYTKEIEKILKKTKYYPPLQELYTDRNLIFAFTYLQNDEGEFLVDVFNADTGEHINSAYFPFVPEIIKNGYAYKFNDWRKNIEFPLIEKYKINPIVYSKIQR